MLSMHILLPNGPILKILVQFENLGFVIMSTRENIRLIARASLFYQNNLTKQVKMPQSQTTDQPTAQQMLVLLKYLKLLELQACFHWVSYCLYKQGMHQMFL